MTTTSRPCAFDCSSTMLSPQEFPQAQAPRHDHRLGEHAARQLGGAHPALDEDDGDLTDSTLLPRGFEQHLHHERVPIRHDPTERDAPERLTPPAPKAAGAVANGQAGHGADVAVGERAQDESVERPVHHADPVQVAGTDDHFVILRRRDQQRQVFRIVRKVRIHLADEVDVPLEREAESLHVGPAEAALAHSVHHVHATGKLPGEIVGHLPGAVGRLVVHDHDRAPFVLQDLPHERSQVLAFVVSRDHDQAAWRSHRRPALPSRSVSIAGAQAAAYTISTGSITGIRKRSWGKNTRHTITEAAASNQSATGGVVQPRARHAPTMANGSTSRYDATEATTNRVECSVYDCPTGTTV